MRTTLYFTVKRYFQVYFLMPTHQLKLYYFAVRGRGEYIRQILKLAEVPFEDFHIPMDQWPKFKEEMPLCQVPVLEVDGVKIGQSFAIARYVGEEYGLAPTDNLARARLAMIINQISDTWSTAGVKEWGAIWLGMMPCDDKPAYFRDKIRPHMENCASLVEKYMVENGLESLLSGDKVTWADVVVAEFFSKSVEFGEKDFLEAYPHIQELVDRVQNEPAIKKHIEERPPTPF